VVQDSSLHIFSMIWLTFFVQAIPRFRGTAPQKTFEQHAQTGRIC